MRTVVDCKMQEVDIYLVQQLLSCEIHCKNNRLLYVHAVAIWQYFTVNILNFFNFMWVYKLIDLVSSSEHLDQWNGSSGS